MRIQLCTLLLMCCAHACASSVLTQHNDNSRTGWNPNEPSLTTSNVNTASFGKVFTRSVDDNVCGQVLIANSITINGVFHQNVMIVYTNPVSGTSSSGQASSLYCFDADDPNASTPLWKTAIDTNGNADTSDCPVIDPSTGTIYLVSDGNSGANRLHAYNITTGLDKTGSPIAITGSVPGTSSDSSGGTLTFNSSHHNTHPGLLLLNIGGVPTLYIAFSHNRDDPPYHGWVFAYSYDQTKFTQKAIYCTTPDSIGSDGGIWHAGKGLVADAQNNIYCTTGNGSFDNTAAGTSKAMAFLKLSPSLTVLDWFAPAQWQAYSGNDADTSRAGPLFIPGTTRLFAAGTNGGLGYLVDSTNLGHWNGTTTDTCIQSFSLMYTGTEAVAYTGPAGTFAFCQGSNGNGNFVAQRKYDPAAGNGGQFTTIAPYKQGTNYAPAWGNMALSSDNQGNNAILWAVNTSGNTLYAYDATDVSKTPLWTSAQNSTRDGMGEAAHFSFPTVANGKVYVPVVTPGANVLVYGSLIPPVFTSVTISPTSPTISINSPQQFSAMALDQNTLPLSTQPTFTWSATGSGSVNSSGLFTSGATGGTATVTVSATVSGVTKTATANILVGQVLTSVVVSPTPVTVATNKTQQFAPSGQDQNGAPMNPQPTFTWSAAGGGTIGSSTGLYTAGSTNASVTVTASATVGNATASGTASVTVTVPVLTTITVAPANQTVAINSNYTFTAAGFDQSATPMVPTPTYAWSVSGGGTINSSTGVFTAGASVGGPFTVTATSGGKTGTAKVFVTATPYGIDTLGQIGPYLNNSMPITIAGAIPATLSATGAFSNTATLTPAPGLMPYNVNTPLFSDNAVKTRWTALATGTTANFASTGEWTWPNGTVFIKHFELGTDDTNPAVRQRLETRLIVRDSTGFVYGVTYKWRADNSDADLVAAAGDQQDFTIKTAGGGTRTQTWYYPSQANCISCHTVVSGGVLGVKSRQLNGNYKYTSGVTDNQLRTRNHLNLFSAPLNEANISGYPALSAVTDTTATLVQRSRSYLDANCFGCHQPNGVADANWDARYDTPLANQRLINVVPVKNLNVAGAHVITPQSPSTSVLYLRIDTVPPDVNTMPQIARHLLDANAVQTISDWINSIPPQALTSIAIAPSSATVSLNGTQQFTAIALDQNAGLMTPQPTFAWSATGVGSIDPASGIFSAGGTSGIATVTATGTVGTATQSASIKITVGTGAQTFTSLKVTPVSVTVNVNTNQQFTGIARDQNGNPMTAQPTITWSASGLGTINTSGLYSAGTAAGSATVTGTATVAGLTLSGTSAVTVSAGPIITTIAGGGNGGDGGPATSASLNLPQGVGVDGAGNVFIAENQGLRVRRVDAVTGVITTAAGGGTGGVGGPATSMRFGQLRSVNVDSAGNLFIVSDEAATIYRVDAATQIITAIAGGHGEALGGDGGPATAASLCFPSTAFPDNLGNLYVADTENMRVRFINSAGVISTLAGTGGNIAGFGYNGDGIQATTAQLNYPWGVCIDSQKNVIIGDTGNNRVRKITVSTGLISTIAGTGTSGFSGDGSLATAAKVSQPNAVVVDSADNIFFADTYNARIRRIDAVSGIITTVAGTTSGYSGDGGLATAAQLSGGPPNGAAGRAIDSAGNLYIADTTNSRIRKVGAATVAPTFTTVAVTPASATLAVNGTKQFSATALDQNGNLLSTQPTITWSVTGGGSINAAGLYTAGSSPGSSTVTASATVSGATNSGTAGVSVAIPVFTSIVVTPPVASVARNGAQQFTAVAMDQIGNPLSSQPTFIWAVNGVGSISPTGLHSVGSSPGSSTVIATASMSGATLSGTAGDTVITPDAAHSTLSPATATITADGMSTQVLTVQVRDANSNNVTSGGSAVVISLSTGTGTIGSTTDNANGTYSATVTSPTALGSGTFAATLDGIAVGTAVAASNSVVTYGAGAVAATGGTVSYTGNYKLRTFTSSGTLNVISGGNLEVLLVAGGAGAGAAGATSRAAAAAAAAESSTIRRTRSLPEPKW